jgi:hydrogenase maturation protease
MSKILVAGMGNLLRRDDGFGVEVARRLAEQGGLPAYVKIVEVGIGGVHLVQELLSGYDVLVIVDAVERDRAPGTVHVLEADVPDLADWPERARENFLADMHYTTPTKALILAKALGVLPPKTFIVGCQPADAADLGIGLSEPVENAVQSTLEQLGVLIQDWVGD